MSKQKFYCSFCGKDNDEVSQLIAGPTVFICNECVVLAMAIVMAKERKPMEDVEITRESARKVALEALVEVCRGGGPSSDRVAAAELLLTVTGKTNYGEPLGVYDHWTGLYEPTPKPAETEAAS